METKNKEILLEPYDSEDVQIAICAAMQMTRTFKEDFCILFDLRVVRLRDNEEPPLEIIRYNSEDAWRY
jgi:hypothetical protein